MNQSPNNHEDPRLAEMLDVIFKFAAGDLTARGTLSEDDSALDGVMAGINILGEELEASVAERKRAEDAVAAREKKFRDLVEATADWIWEVDDKGVYTYCSPRVRDMLGYEPPELIGKSPFDLMPAAEAARVATIFGALVPERKPMVALENVNLHKDGREVMLETSGVPFFDSNGAFKGYRGIDRDITERKRAQRALSESEHLLSTIFDSVQDGIVLVDAQSRRFRMGNTSLHRMLGYSPDEFLELRIEDIHREEDIAYVTRQIERQLKHEINLAPNMPVKRKDGTIFYADINANPMNVKGASFLLGVFRDITERRLAEEQIRKLNKALEEKVQQLLETQDELVRKEKLAILGQVAGSVGHELRNPLGVMSNAVYFLQTVLSDADETTKEYLNIIKDEIACSERIVSDLLDSVRTKPPQPEIVGVQELIDQTLRKCSVPPSVTVKLEIPATLPPLRVDAMQIQQVLRNLISNGVEAMPEGGTLEIRAVEDAQAKTVTVSVRDSGTGMAPEVLAKLFQLLFTTKARGIGLGLVVVKNLTEANGGSVKVESEVGKGSVFSVTLPADQSKGT